MNRPEDEDDALVAALTAHPHRTALAEALYVALKNTGTLHAHRLAAYRCPYRCSLLDVVDTPQGRIIGFPRYKTSPKETEANSSESGRRANTEDGQRRWRQHAAFIENVSNPPLSCDHLRGVALTDDAIRADLEAGHAEVEVRADGSRYAR